MLLTSCVSSTKLKSLSSMPTSIPISRSAIEALGKAVDKAERARLLREIGDHKFNEFADMPLFWLFAEAGVNPKYISEYTFPGSITGFFTHLEYLKLAQ